MKPKRKEGGSTKRTKLETTDGQVWGEAVMGVANSAVRVATSIGAAANLDDWTERGPVRRDCAGCGELDISVTGIVLWRQIYCWSTQKLDLEVSLFFWM